ncbi:MAG: chorismate-binding protein [Bacteroidota bacterium]
MPSKKKNDLTALFRDLADHLRSRLPFVIYRKPTAHNIYAIFQDDNDLIYDFSLTQRGFVFSPFDDLTKTILLRPDREVVVTPKSFRGSSPFKKKVADSNKDGYVAMVSKAIQLIGEGKLSKVVLSRKIRATTLKSPFGLFGDALLRYPDAFCYLWYHPKVGFWFGATPETLVKTDRETMETMALAATFPVEENKAPTWYEKEFDEQQFVTDFIVDRLSTKIGELQVKGPEPIQAGHLWHLRSTIAGKLNSDSKLSEVVSLLHPTPAVCGIPQETAKRFIQKNEGYNREFYTGFLGEINFETNSSSHLFVNLRCAKIEDGLVSIYVGGGITKDSDPEKEWEETEHKCDTIFGLL